jgi:hypothetical protein
MKKFVILHTKYDITAFKLGDTIYYIDSRNKDMSKVYDAELNRLNVILPEAWLFNSTNGEVSLPVLKYIKMAYEKGYENGMKSNARRHFSNFVVKLKNILYSRDLRTKFINIFSIELNDFERTKIRMRKLISDKQLLELNKGMSKNLLSRTLKISKENEDYELSKEISDCLEELDCESVDIDRELFKIFNMKEDIMPVIYSNIELLLKRKA